MNGSLPLFTLLFQWFSSEESLRNYEMTSKVIAMYRKLSWNHAAWIPRNYQGIMLFFYGIFNLAFCYIEAGNTGHYENRDFPGSAHWKKKFQWYVINGKSRARCCIWMWRSWARLMESDTVWWDWAMPDGENPAGNTYTYAWMMFPEQRIRPYSRTRQRSQP